MGGTSEPSRHTASTVDVHAQARPDGPSIRLNQTPMSAWFEVWYAIHGHGSDPQIEWDPHRNSGLAARVQWAAACTFAIIAVAWVISFAA